MGRGKKSDMQRVEHMKRHCEDIASFIERFGRDFDTFTSDRAYYSAVGMCVFQIGEMANGLSEEFREKTKDRVQWKRVRGMRNWLAHAYEDVEAEVIWETVNNDVPALLQFCEDTLSAE